MIWALHGAFGSPTDWDRLAAALDIELRPVDLWSPEHDLPLTAWARRFCRTVSETDHEPVLLGYSMGARLGLHALLETHGLWRGAILVSAHPGLASTSERAERRAHDDAWLRRFEDLGWPDFWAAWSAQNIFGSGVSRETPRYRDGMRRGLAAWSLSEQRDLRPELAAVECPVLWVTGGRDRKFTALAEGVVPSMIRARHEVVPAAGHRVPWDDPAAFAATVEDFRPA